MKKEWRKMPDILIKGIHTIDEPTPIMLYPDGRWLDYTKPTNSQFGNGEFSILKSHGRCVDADALIDDYTPDSYDLNKMHISEEVYNSSRLTVREMKSIIKKAPTIVPAEGGTVDGN